MMGPKFAIFLVIMFAAQTYSLPVVVTIFGGNYTADVNTRVVLPCNFYPKEDHLVVWYFSKSLIGREERLFNAAGKKVTSRNNISLIRRKTIVITECQEQDTGYYTTWIWTSRVNYRIIHQLTVERPPRIWVAEPRIIAEEGTSIQIPCYGHRMNEPFLWSKLKGPELEGNYTQNGSTLCIPYVTLSHEGIWQCSGEIWGGQRVDIVEIIVHYKPRIRLEFFSLPDGESVTIRCSAVGKPSVNTLDILRNGHPVSQDKMVKVVKYTNTNFNVFLRTARNDTIECVAHNQVGQSRVSRDLRQEKIFLKVSARDTGFCSKIIYNVSWTVGNSAGIWNLNVSYRKEESEWMQAKVETNTGSSTKTSQFSTMLRNLDPNSKYLVQVQMENQFGSSVTEVLQFSTTGTTCKKLKSSEPTSITVFLFYSSVFIAALLFVLFIVVVGILIKEQE